MNDSKYGRKVWIAALIVLTFLIYGRTIGYGFVWDDERSHLTAHEDLMEGNVGKLITKTYDGMYIPVTYLTWNAVKTFAKDGDKLKPGPFHFLNVLFHAINVVLLFLILLLVFENNVAAFIGAFVFGFHPLQVESVAWISEFRGVYSCFFSLMALLVLFRSLKKQSFTSAKELITSKFFLGATALFVCALLSKPTAVMLPFITVLLVWCFFRESFVAVRNAVIIWICIVIPVALSTSGAQQNQVMDFVTPFGQRFALVGYSIGFYLVKIFVPVKLAPSYGITPQVIVQDAMAYAALVIILAVAGFLFWKREKYKFLFTGYSLFVLSLLPVTGIFTFYFQRYSNVADRYVYFGMIGFAIIIAYTNAQAKWKWLRNLPIGLVAGFLIFSGAQVRVWENEFSIWNESLVDYPEQFQAAYNRGVARAKKGESEKAIYDYTTAIRHNPKSKDAFVNRGNEYGKTGKYEEALRDYDSALILAPNDGSIYYNRALTNFFMKNYEACPPDIIKAQEFGFVIDMQFATAVRDSMHAARKRDSLR
jgi:protein O-mannosyl-transferase